MNKVTGVLSALLGAGLIASITLNVCYHRKFKEDKANAVRQAAAVKKARFKTKARIRKSKPENLPLIVKNTGRYDENTAYIEFNADPAKLSGLKKEQISISPALPFTISSNHFCYVRINAEFQPETTYRFTVRKGVTDDDGRKLDYDAEFRIRFPAKPTVLSALSSGDRKSVV